MSTFSFEADEAGCYFEWRLWDKKKYKEMVPWTKTIRKVDVSWLDWRKNGPGGACVTCQPLAWTSRVDSWSSLHVLCLSDGDYILYVRAVDPAGNSDERYVPGRNWYSWHYVSPIPWDIIFGSLGAFFCKQPRTVPVSCTFVRQSVAHRTGRVSTVLVLVYLFERRRRARKAAMERYAMKRMRRKFKVSCGCRLCERKAKLMTNIAGKHCRNVRVM